jgi:hypothetical protein
VVRRRLTVRRIDPWSVLKFGAVVNLALLAIGLLVSVVVWFFIERLELVDPACGLMLDVGFTRCAINAGNLFRALILLGLLWLVVQTAVYVFLAFLHNLIADLTGGLTYTVIDDSPTPAVRTEPTRRVTTASTPPDHTTSRPRATEPATASPPVPPLRRDTRDEPTQAYEPVRRDDGGEDLFGER